MTDIAARINSVLDTSGLNARNLAALSKVHYTTIYLILRKGQRAKPLATVRESIDSALDKIEALTKDGKLPLDAALSQDAKQTILEQLISTIAA